MTKKESGAQRRKKQKLEEKQDRKAAASSKKIFQTFLFCQQKIQHHLNKLKQNLMLYQYHLCKKSSKKKAFHKLTKNCNYLTRFHQIRTKHQT